MSAPHLMERLPEVAERIQRADALLLGLDFDGTLAPICPRPEDVALAESVRELLSRLARSPKVALMIVSGRALADVRERLGLNESYYVAGNHGMELQGPGIDFVEPTAAALGEALRDLDARLSARLADVPGALVEPKGLTTSVHDRNVAPERREGLERVVREVVAPHEDRFVVTSGHHVWEVRPRARWHKGKALAQAREHLGDPSRRLVVYIGDDQTDEDAFATFPDGLTVRVAPPTTPTRAQYRLDAPADVERFLAWLADNLA